MSNWAEDDYSDDYDDSSEIAELDYLASERDHDDADVIVLGVEPMGACPCCDGSGRVVVDIRHVPDTWTDPGYDEEITERCDDCGGSGCMPLGRGGEIDSTLDDELFDPGYAMALDRQSNQVRA